MKTFILLAVIVLLGLSEASISDIERGFREIVLARNFALEEHNVVTQDGYILTIFRIPGKLGELN